MATYHLALAVEFVATNPDDADERFEEFASHVMDELLALEEQDEGLIDPDIAASIRDREIEMQMSVEAASRDDALRLFLANFRTALHAAGCHTGNWPQVPRNLGEPQEVQFA